MSDVFGAVSPLVLCGLLAGLLSTMAFAPYIRDMMFGATRPLRASWLIWSVLSAISFASQVAEGATASLWFAAMQMSGTVLVFVISVRLGTGGYINLRDGATLALAALGLGLWYATSNPAFALAISIGISLTGGSVTVWKAFKAPASETLATWALGFVASGLALVAVGGLDPLLMAYPAYLLVLNGAIVLAILLGRARARGTVAATFAAE